MDHYRLLYVLEKVKVACRREHGVYHTFADREDGEHEACLRLEEDGLIRRVGPEDGEHFMWEPA